MRIGGSSEKAIKQRERENLQGLDKAAEIDSAFKDFKDLCPVIPAVANRGDSATPKGTSSGK